jgi:glycosyltransferase involved in cell wall biosynthesis
VQVPSKRERWWSIFRFPLAARRMGARAIHTQYNLSPLVGKRGITTIHDVSFFVEPEWFRPLDRATLQRFVPPSARRAKFVLTVSNTSRADIERFIPGIEGKVVVTPNACNPAIAPMDRDEATHLVRRELNVESPFILTVGTRAPRKNMNLATAAADRLPSELPHILVVSGKEGWGEEKLGRRASTVGYATDRQLAALYSAADLYLAPSLYEGFGITILEAFTCGCPVLCSDGGAQPEVAGKAAMIMRGSNAGEWSSAIVGLLKDTSRLESMRELGRRRAKEFSWKDMARRTAEVYSEVMR